MVKALENTIKDIRAAQPSTSKNWRGGTTKKRWKTTWSSKQGGAKHPRTNEYRSRKGTRDYRRENKTESPLEETTPAMAANTLGAAVCQADLHKKDITGTL
ncbi:unnamed protein product [Callosobruchus maculatus]|uniref:Uncharacterized protein n=1 Tax=Callosobruchus maculatus TaxID=64391 RepID=A0A653D802_CALMS|nr:unnamed protein product [Callosobruchus maculatus]